MPSSKVEIGVIEGDEFWRRESKPEKIPESVDWNQQT